MSFNPVLRLLTFVVLLRHSTLAYDNLEAKGCLSGNATAATAICHRLSLAYSDQVYFPNTSSYLSEADGLVL